MQIERISADITLKHKPRTGTQAYNMLIESLKAEIQEKQEILSHLSQDKVKQKFIENWNPTTRSVNIYDMQEGVIFYRGYKQVDVCNDEGIKKHMRVHRLVYMAHKGVIPEGMQINHKDENKANNCIDNLELMTNKENCSYGTRNARISQAMKRYRAKQRAMAAC